MIGVPPPYVMLMASLPALGPLLSEKEPSINEARLEQRLKMLAPEDRETLDRVRSLLSWAALELSEDDAAFLARARETLAAIESEAIRAVLRDRLEIRTVLAALRRRQAGEEAPTREDAWGYGRYVETIRAHWAAPDFGLRFTFPWVVAAGERLKAEDRKGLERIALEAAWKVGERHLALHQFDFEAVFHYVLRWSLVDRWSRYDADAAAVRFAELLDAAFADSPALQEAA